MPPSPNPEKKKKKKKTYTYIHIFIKFHKYFHSSISSPQPSAFSSFFPLSLSLTLLSLSLSLLSFISTCFSFSLVIPFIVQVKIKKEYSLYSSVLHSCPSISSIFVTFFPLYIIKIFPLPFFNIISLSSSSSSSFPIISQLLPLKYFLSLPPRRMSRPGDWNCRSCQHLNFQRRDSCQRCGEPRPGGGDYGSSFMGRSGGGSNSPFGFSSISSAGPDVRPGDWYCTFGGCGAHNFASRSSCFKCGALKDETSAGFDGGDHVPRARGLGFGFGGGSGGSRSGWKSGDWICNRTGCNEHNFASRTECFRCSAPRESSSRPSY